MSESKAKETVPDNPVQSSEDKHDKPTWGQGLRNRFAGNGKKFVNTSRFVVSSQVWANTIPTRDCDVLLTFPAKTSDTTLMWVLARLRQRTPELSVHVRHHSNTGVYGFYITAAFENLLRGAEELAIRKAVTPEHGGGLKEFVLDEQETFVGIDDPDAFFTSQERQAIVKNMLYNLRAVEGDVLDKVKFLEGQAIIPLLISKKMAKGLLPIHNSDDLAELRKTWVQAFFRSQPLDRINNYFGVKIAMYFAYLGHYTKALIFPAILGTALWLFSRKDQAREDIVFVIFSFVNVIWATLYLEDWKRKSAEKAYHWGTLDREDDLLCEPRPLYHGKPARSRITGRLEPTYPAWKRTLFRYFVSGPIIIACISVVFITMWTIFGFQDMINAMIKAEELPKVAKFLPKIMLALSIGILDDIYKKIAYWLNDKENYRLDESYENNLIIKLIAFQFVNSYLSLFYIAFYLQDMERLKDQLAALLITRQVIGNIKEALVPYVIEKAKQFRIGYKMSAKMSPDTLDKTAAEIMNGSNGKHSKNGPAKAEQKSEIQTHDGKVEGSDEQAVKEEIGAMQHSGPHMTQAELEGSMKKYEDTFEDYLEMLIQFGYVTLFSAAFPCAAMCALLNNIIEIRSDAFKLCMTLQRPFGQRAENIGGWQDALEIMSVIAIMVNCALIGMSGLADRIFPDMSMVGRIVFIVVLEHVILACRMLLAFAIPDVPDWVAEEKARLEFHRREAHKRLQGGGSATASPLSPSLAPLPSYPASVNYPTVSGRSVSPHRTISGAPMSRSISYDQAVTMRQREKGGAGAGAGGNGTKGGLFYTANPKPYNSYPRSVVLQTRHPTGPLPSKIAAAAAVNGENDGASTGSLGAGGGLYVRKVSTPTEL